MSGPPRCGSCRAFIRWVEKTDGGRIPLDFTTDEANATIWLNPDGRARFLSKDEIVRARAAGQRLYSLHHTTCPSVERHRVSRAQTSLDLFGGDAA